MTGIHPLPGPNPTREQLREYAQWYVSLSKEEQENERVKDILKEHAEIERLVEKYRTKKKKQPEKAKE